MKPMAKNSAASEAEKKKGIEKLQNQLEQARLDGNTFLAKKLEDIIKVAKERLKRGVK